MDPALIGLGVGAAVLLVLLSWGFVRVGRRARELHDAEMGLLDHLRELRYRLLASVAAVTGVTVFLFSFDVRTVDWGWYAGPMVVPSVLESVSSRILDAILDFALPEFVIVTVIAPSEAILAQFQAAIIGGLVLASPIVAYQVASFIAPALHDRERRVVGLVTPVAFVLFLGGVAFGLFVMVPVALSTLYEYAQPLGAQALARPGEIITFVTFVCLLFGAAFEMPLVMTGLAYAGILSPSTMARHWRGVIVGVLILAAVVTDPTPISQVIVATPLIVLYFIGLGAAKVAWTLRGTERDRSPTTSFS